MKDNIKLIGRKIKGFIVDESKPATTQDFYLDEIGVITYVSPDGTYASVSFSDGANFRYPLDQVHEHLIPEQTEEEKTRAADALRMRLGFVDKKVKPLGKEKVQEFIEDPSPYDSEAIEEAIVLLGNAATDAEMEMLYPHKIEGSDRHTIQELNEISRYNERVFKRLNKVIEYLEQLK